MTANFPLSLVIDRGENIRESLFVIDRGEGNRHDGVHH